MKTLLFNIVPSIIAAILLQIFMHELGHMVGGLISRWKLIYMQLFHIVLLKEDKYKIKKISTSGFQCIMYPSELNRKALLYTMGGCFMNLFVALIALTLLFLYHENKILWIYVWSIFSMGIVMLIFNSVPNTKRLCNDGACLKLLLSDHVTHLCHDYQFMTAKQLFDGHTYKDIERNKICLLQEKADNDILAYQAVLEYYYWMDLERYDLMKKALGRVDMDSPVSLNVKNIIEMERLYSEVLSKLVEMDTEPINKNQYGGDINQYINIHETKGDVHSERVKATFEVYSELLKGNERDALCCINKTIQYLKSLNCIYAGEASFCVNQLEKLRVFCG